MSEPKVIQKVEEFDAHKADYAQFKEDTEITIGTAELPTSDQTLKGAIAEVFQTGNNVKSDTVGALLSVDDSLPITSTSAWDDIVTQIGNISTGYKKASGSFTYSFSGSEGNISIPTVLPIDFTPTKAFVAGRLNDNNSGFIYGVAGLNYQSNRVLGNFQGNNTPYFQVSYNDSNKTLTVSCFKGFYGWQSGTVSFEWFVVE